MERDKIVICDLDHENVLDEKEVLDRAGYSFRWLHCKTQQEVIEQCKGAVVLLNQYVRMDRVIFEALPEVKCVVRYGVGYDNVDLKDAARYGVEVCNIPDYGTCEVADQALAHMMNLARKISYANGLIHQGVWDYRRNIPIRRLGQCTVGICGVGRIGSEFARRAAALGSKIIAYDIEEKDTHRHFPDFVEFVSFEELLERSDILSIHCPLDEHTRYMFSVREFEKMKDSALLINVARGGIVDEDALLWALREKKIAGAALDVVEKEPLLPGNPLLALDNFVVTPHSAWYSEESSHELKRKAAEEGVRFLNGEAVHYSVRKKAEL